MHNEDAFPPCNDLLNSQSKQFFHHNANKSSLDCELSRETHSSTAYQYTIPEVMQVHNKNVQRDALYGFFIRHFGGKIWKPTLDQHLGRPGGLHLEYPLHHNRPFRHCLALHCLHLIFAILFSTIYQNRDLYGTDNTGPFGY